MDNYSDSETKYFLHKDTDEEVRQIAIKARIKELTAECEFQNEYLDGGILFGVVDGVVHTFRGHFRRAGLADWLLEDENRRQVTRESASAIWALARVEHLS